MADRAWQQEEDQDPWEWEGESQAPSDEDAEEAARFFLQGLNEEAAENARYEAELARGEDSDDFERRADEPPY